MLFDLLLADAHGLALLEHVVGHGTLVVLGGDPHHRAQGLNHGGVVHKAVGAGTYTVLDALARLHDDPLAVFDGQAVGVEIILFSARFESDADDLGHVADPPVDEIALRPVQSIPSKWPAPTLKAQASRQRRSRRSSPAV